RRLDSARQRLRRGDRGRGDLLRRAARAHRPPVAGGGRRAERLRPRGDRVGPDPRHPRHPGPRRGARMPTAAELPPGLAMLAQQSPLSLGAANPEGDVSRLTQVLDQTIAARSAQWQATQAGQAQNQPTVTGMAPSWGAPAIYASPSEPGPAQSGPAQSGPAQSGPAQSGPAQSGPRPTGPGDSGSVPTRRMRRR